MGDEKQMTVQGLSLEHIARQNAELKVLLSTIDVKLQEGSKARQAADSAAASIRILEKKNLVLNNENRRLFRKIDDLGNVIEEQAARIEELEEGQAVRRPQGVPGPDYKREIEALKDDLNRADSIYKESVKVNHKLLEDLRQAKSRIKELEGGDFPHYAYEKEKEEYKGRCQDYERVIEATSAENRSLLEKIEHERSVNADLKEAQQAAARKVLQVEMENARLLSRLADVEKENAHIQALLKKLGFNYISVFPVPVE